jgi:hypothetical protein
VNSTSDPVPPAEGGGEELAQLVAHFVSGKLDAAGRQRLVALVRADPDAARMYRDALQRAATQGRVARTRREEAAGRRAEARRKRDRLERVERRRGVVSDKSSRARARTLLLPAAFLFAVWSMTRPSGEPPALSLAWSAGEVQASGEALGSERPDAPLRRGDWALARGDARAEIVGGDTEIGLCADTWVMIEAVEPPRMRLEAGALEVRGPCTVTTRSGVAEVEEGSARVAIEQQGLSVSCRRGRVIVVDAGGERVLGPGDRVGAGLETAAAGGWVSPSSDR